MEAAGNIVIYLKNIDTGKKNRRWGVISIPVDGIGN